MPGYYDFNHHSYYDISSDRTVPIRSPVGQAQFFLSAARGWITASNEWLLLCRFANTIDISSGEREIRQLKRLTRYLDQQDFEKRHGYVDPIVAREVEQEIILRQEQGGYDLTPAMQLLSDYERKAPIFSQPERNLILRDAFLFGDQTRTTKIADAFCEKQLSPYGIEKLCREMEKAELEWVGVETMDGLQYQQTSAPGLKKMSLKDCEDPQTDYPPFTYYPSCDQPTGSIVLSDGVILAPDQKNWFYSCLQRVDQTYTALHFYQLNKQGTFEIADDRHEEWFLYQYPEPIEEIPLVGQVTFADDDLWNFTSAEKYLQVIRDELPHSLSTGFHYETLTDDPAIHKAVDKIYEEVSPHALTDRHGINMVMGGMG